MVGFLCGCGVVVLLGVDLDERDVWGRMGDVYIEMEEQSMAAFIFCMEIRRLGSLGTNGNRV